MKNTRKAFSLIELLIVITIIGILVVAFLPSITSGPSRARDVQRISDIADASLALEMYFQDTGVYPDAVSDLLPASLESYFDSNDLPADPSTGTVYHYETCDTKQGYIVAAKMENNKSTDNYHQGTYSDTMGMIDDTTCGIITGFEAAVDETTGEIYAILKD
ncbi:type II secretion system protein [Candidatus Peregrinibacteria bacterium]|jgi:prepilin-type N-terminal cleavage/methylation domain-containing protein|nr:type II secretion system protein [Candidatus Peregrinibacteria bacterium]